MDKVGLVQHFKYPFCFAKKRTYEAPWSREVPENLGWRKRAAHRRKRARTSLAHGG